MNKVILMGRLTRAPEVRYSDGADPLAVARYTLAVNRRMKKNGEQDADFIPCVAFGKTGEFAEKYFKKGQLVAITGRLQVRSWDKDGERRWSTDVIVEEQYFAEGKHDSEKTAEASLHRNRTVPQRHRVSLRRRPENKWGWRSRRGSIPLTRVLRMMICRFEE